MISYMLGSTVIAVDKSGVWLPGLGSLILQFLAVRIVITNTSGNFLVNSIPYNITDLAHDWQDLTDIHEVVAIVIILTLLTLKFFQIVHIEAGSVWRFDNIVKQFEGNALVAWDLDQKFFE